MSIEEIQEIGRVASFVPFSLLAVAVLFIIGKRTLGWLTERIVSR